MTNSDARPAIIQFVEAVNRAASMPMGLETFEPEGHATAPTEDHLPAGDQDRVRIEIAARYALNTHPGPVGELIHRELHAFLEFGYRFDNGTGLATRLVELVMAIALQDAFPR